MHESPFDATLLQLLDELQTRIQSESALTQEWESALRQEPWCLQEGAEARFLEWFLLERESASLGAAPAVFWAPASIQADEPWARLLDANLGLFRPNGAQNGQAMLLDSWTGQNFQTAYPKFEDTQATHFLLVGRLALNEEGLYQPLPGAQAMMQEGLIAALDADICRIRGENPRECLSQLQLERLLLAQQSSDSGATGTDQVLKVQAMVDALPGWSWREACQIAQEHGAQELIDQLAFESNIDLEALQSGIAVALASASLLPTTDSSSTVDALTAFDQLRCRGGSIEGAFAMLEAQLNLPPGVSDELDPEQTDEGEAGPLDDLVDANYFLDAYLFDLASDPIPESQLQEIKSFANGITPQSSGPHIVAKLTTQLIQSPQEQVFEQRWALYQPFLKWLCVEQGMPLEEWLETFSDEGLERIRKAVSINSGAATATDGANTQMAKVAEISPIRVHTQDQDQSASVECVPKEATSLIRVGDLLIGTWRAGSFHMTKYLPKEVLPGSTEQPAE
ncbi:MAG: hypothetical protein HOM34_03395 [Planctomycetes bacterium]|nr:hypothetical protein [Planctomycetota bacterium]MBT4029649.1 hypothetical protein [Planctomycetota bacterium]MBT4561149.1 hypothetical protein [Planctomycetota bacterium]MBT5101099.1 hypothetical protein [Planctomycetota bacterium]MBT5119752.1 hypothetical protein [Planctomycetota bacterium]